jgi:hypothetical protein
VAVQLPMTFVFDQRVLGYRKKMCRLCLWFAVQSTAAALEAAYAGPVPDNLSGVDVAPSNDIRRAISPWQAHDARDRLPNWKFWLIWSYSGLARCCFAMGEW